MNSLSNGTSIKPYIKDDSGKEGWDIIKPQLEEAKSGDTVTVAMNGTTVVPKDVIDSIKGKDTTLVLDMGNGLSWKIYGKDITDAAGDIDFDVTVGADAGKSIPVDVINNVTGERSSVVSSLILRELFADVTRVWKLKYLAEKVDCSIGQVSKVINFLLENAWAEKTKDGYMLRESESLLHEWSSIYGKKEASVYACYSLDNVSVLENKLKLLKKNMGIESYLTGFSGGVRYAPVIRYNKVHMYLAPEDIQEAISYLEMKEVSSGSNVVIFPLENDSYIKDSREIEESLVVSPIQIYLDCMQLKGRGEEMAEAVLMKEIFK